MNAKKASLLTATTLLGWTSAPGAQQALLESPSRAFPTGHQVTSDAYRPEHTACADMDGDGDVDLVVAHAGNPLQPKISVLFNQGDGGFGPPVNYLTPGQTMDVALADLDGDGDIDAAFAESDNLGNGVRALVYENTGDGTLLPYVDYTVGVGPTGIAAADVDLDGDVDLITANSFWLQEDVTVLYNDGAGGFFARVDVPITGHDPTRVEAGDLNGDGAPELVVALDAGNPSFAVLVNDGFGAYGAPEFYSTGFTALYDAGVAVADVDLDGDRDVLFGTSTNGGAGYTKGFALFRNNGEGMLGAPESVPIGQTLTVLFDFAVADVTGDGWPDVLGTVKNSDRGLRARPRRRGRWLRASDELPIGRVLARGDDGGHRWRRRPRRGRHELRLADGDLLRERRLRPSQAPALRSRALHRRDGGRRHRPRWRPGPRHG